MTDKKIFLRFIADRSFVSRGIQWREVGRPSHVEYVTYTNYRGTEQWLTFGARLQGGVTFRPLNYCKPTWEEWYVFPGIEASYNEALGFYGRKYDWADIIEIATGIYPRSFNPQRPICSVLVGYSNRLAWAQDKAPALINPNVPTRQITPQLVYAACTQQVEIQGR